MFECCFTAIQSKQIVCGVMGALRLRPDIRVQIFLARIRPLFRCCHFRITPFTVRRQIAQHTIYHRYFIFPNNAIDLTRLRHLNGNDGVNTFVFPHQSSFKPAQKPKVPKRVFPLNPARGNYWECRFALEIVWI